MPKFLEDKLKKEYGADSKVPYKVMNKMGAMHGNKETAKGKAMEKKHKADKGGKKMKKKGKKVKPMMMSKNDISDKLKKIQG